MCPGGGVGVQVAGRGGFAWAGHLRGSQDSQRGRHPKGVYSSGDIFILSRCQLGTFSSFLLELPEPTQSGWRETASKPLLPARLLHRLESLLEGGCYFPYLQDPLLFSFCCTSSAVFSSSSPLPHSLCSFPPYLSAPPLVCEVGCTPESPRAPGKMTNVSRSFLPTSRCGAYVWSEGM